MRSILLSIFAAVVSAAASAATPVEDVAAAVANELARLCPPAQPGDQAAFDRCREGLFQDSKLRQALAPRVLWGRRHQDPATSLKDTTLTQFAPDVLAGL